MSQPLNLALEHIEKYKTELQTDHLARQAKIWEFTIKQKPKKEPEIKPNFQIGNTNKPDDYGTPISLEKPLHFILGDVKNNSSLESNASFHSANNSLDKNSLGSKPKVENTEPCNNNNNAVAKSKITIKMPKFAIGEPISDMINYNMSLRHE